MRVLVVEDESDIADFLRRGLVEAHDGNISVKSTIGQGSVFTIRLPAYRLFSRPQQVTPTPVTPYGYP